MVLININGSDDIYYRYTMNDIIIKHYGNNNKLYLDNIQLIANQLNIDVNYLIKHISYELSTNNGYDKMKGFWINKSIADKNIIQQKIYDFINIFILCKQCGNPETKLYVKNDKLKQNCISCGVNSTINTNYKILFTIIKKLSTK